MIPYAPWFAWILPFIGCLLTLLLSKTNSKISNYISTASIGLSAFFSLSMIPDVITGYIVDWRFPLMFFEIGVLVDPLNVLMACIVSVIGFLVALFSVGYMKNEQDIARFWFLIQLFIGGYLTIVLSNNLLLTFIGWEIVGLCCMLLASFWYRDPYKARIGLKTGMILRIGDLALLASILVIYVYSGTFNITELQQSTDWVVNLSITGILPVTTILFLIGVMDKAAQFPLQEWLPDMLHTSPSSFNALTECLAGPYLLARMLPIFHKAYATGVGELSIFFLATAWIGILTALISALIATSQRNIFKILAYSVSSVIGYMLVALGLAGLSNDLAPGYLAGTFLLTVDAFITGLLFLSAVYITYLTGLEDIFDIAGVKSKLAHRGIEIGVFAMICVPPLSGFWCTNWIQTVALNLASETARAGQQLLMFSSYLLFLLLIIVGGITAFYGLRMMWTIFCKDKYSSYRGKLRKIPEMIRLPFIAMLIITMIIDFSAPLLIPMFNSFFFPILQKRFLENIFEVGWYIIPSISTVMTLVALASGAYLAYRAYMSRNINPKKLMVEHVFLSKMHQALLNRLYIDTFYHRVAQHIFSFANVILKRLEQRIDSLNGLLANLVRSIANVTLKRLEQRIDSLNGLFAKLVFSISQNIFKYVEIEGVSQLQIKGFSEIFNAITSRMTSISEWAYPRLELKGFEDFYKTVAKSITRIVEKVRDAHTGILSYNMLAILIGIILLIVFIIYGRFLWTFS